MTNTMHIRRRTGLIAMSVVALVGLAVILPSSGQGRGTIYDSGDIIVADQGHQQIKAIDPVTGAATAIGNATWAFPADLTFADDGDFFVVDTDAFGGPGGIRRIDSVTGNQTAISSNLLSDQNGGDRLFKHPISIDRKGDKLYVADYHPPRKIIEVDIATGKQTLVTKAGEMATPLSIAVGEGHSLYVADAGGPGPGRILEINSRTGKQTIVSRKDKFGFPQTLALQGSHTALVTDSDLPRPGRLFSVNLNNGKQTVIAKGPPMKTAGGLTLIDNDTAAVTEYLDQSTNGAIYLVDLNTGDQTLLNGTDVNNPLGLRVAP